jgi:fibronectin type 3 domain-containing protein
MDYQIWRNTVNDSGSATSLGSDSASPFIDSPTPGTTYFYWVTANNACGSSGFGAPDTGVTNTAPGAPTAVTASDNTSCTTITVTWTPPAGATSFQIWRNTVDNSATATQIATDTASPYDDTTAAGGTTYFYWVRAANACGVGPFSASNSGSRGSGTAPPAPTGVAASDGQCSQTTVSWSAVSVATSYEVWRGVSGSPNNAVLIGTSTLSPFADTTGNFGTKYNYWVKARNVCGVSGFSNRDRGHRVSCP